MAESPNDTVIHPGQTFTDNDNNVWSLVDAHVAINGVADPATINTIAVAWVNGVVWEENWNEVWWQNIAAITPNDTMASWSPPGVGQTTPPPQLPIAVSANDTVVTTPGQVITDTGDVQWAINAVGQVTYNGIIDTSTAHIVQLAYVNGKIWDEDDSGAWASKTTPNQLWTDGADPLPATPPPSGTTLGPPNNFTVQDTTMHTTWQLTGEPYSGPVAGLSDEIIIATSDNINVTAQVANVFIHTGSGEDAINVSAKNGNNVLDGSTGSNFLQGGTGDDTFYVDDRGAPAAIWSTVAGFHSGDNATVWGVTAADFAITTANGEGAIGFTGLTWDFAAAGKPDAKLTLSGFTQADLTDGKLQVSFGSVQGNDYMLVHGV